MRTYFLLAAAVIAAACSSGSDSGPTPAEQCNQVMDTACSANATCAVSTGKITQAEYNQFVTSCKAGAATTLDCSRVLGVNGSPSACEADYATEPCSLFQLPDGLPVPASCRGLFLR